MRQSKPRVAVFGAGYWGKNLVRNFHSLGALRWVCDPRAEVLAATAEAYPQVRVTPSFKDVLADEEVAGVVIATPAETHHALARAALEADRDVLVEKPLALCEEDGEDLVRLAETRERVLQVGHILDYHPAVEALLNLVRNGELGRVQYVYSNRLNLGKVRREENILWSFAPHDISLITAIVGAQPELVAASGGAYLQPHISDVTVTTLRFPGDLRAHIFVSWLHPIKEQRLVVVGSRAMAVFDDTRPFGEKVVVYDHRIDWIEHQPVPKRAEARPVPVEEAEPMRLECEDFLSCIRNRARPRSDGRNGLRVLQVLAAAQRSLEAGGEPVTLADSGERADPYPGVRIHPTATVDDGATIGEGTSIWHYAHVMPGAVIGERCILGQNVFVAPGTSIGNNVKIQNNVAVYEGLILEDDVFCGPSMVFTNVSIPRSHHPRRGEYEVTRIRRGATLGANSTIVCGTTVNEYGFVGAGAVVTREVPPFALVLGAPARVAGWRCICGEAIPFAAVTEGEEASVRCAACDRSYSRSGQVVTLDE